MSYMFNEDYLLRPFRNDFIPSYPDSNTSVFDNKCYDIAIPREHINPSSLWGSSREMRCDLSDGRVKVSFLCFVPGDVYGGVMRIADVSIEMAGRSNIGRSSKFHDVFVNDDIPMFVMVSFARYCERRIFESLENARHGKFESVDMFMHALSLASVLISSSRYIAKTERDDLMLFASEPSKTTQKRRI